MMNGIEYRSEAADSLMLRLSATLVAPLSRADPPQGAVLTADKAGTVVDVVSKLNVDGASSRWNCGCASGEREEECREHYRR